MRFLLYISLTTVSVLVAILGVTIMLEAMVASTPDTPLNLDRWYDGCAVALIGALVFHINNLKWRMS